MYYISFLDICQGVAIYPREGTETFVVDDLVQNSPRCNLSPRGDGNGQVPPRGRGGLRVAIYPREGTETRRHFPADETNPLQFIPARGRKPFLGSLLHLLPGCNLSPRGDGNVMVLPTKSDILSCNLSPRGDGNSIRPRDVHGYAMLQFIPARGRKHFLQRFNKCAAVSGLQFIPARGRKQPRRPVKTANLPRCNLSPRGDGNHAHDVVPYAVVRCNLSPRGDGNQLSIREWWEVGKIVAIYPREGTETISKSHIASPLWLQFIPARGRKPTHQHHWFCRHPPVAIYPREGTETCSHQRARSIPDCCNLSPRGDGNRSVSCVHLITPAPLQFIPARGRKRSRRPHRLHWPPLQFIPARGRKR